jgi:ferritin-like metal-binding protein YciE
MDNPLRELFIEELRDLYNAENCLTKAVPRIAQASTSHEIRSRFEHHLKLTWLHVEDFGRSSSRCTKSRRK